MNRWRVYKDISFPRSWVAVNTGDHSELERFSTHSHAVAYADRMARTREVVLPCLAPQGEVTVSAVWEYDRLTVYYCDASGEVVQGTPADLVRHAVTLLTLAEQEEEK